MSLHISLNAKQGEIAKTVLMPGDPLRAKFVADTLLENVVQVNDVRNMWGYTGTYQGRPVSVIPSGMGMPSIGIYSHELYAEYGVESIIRIGTAGLISSAVKSRDIVFAMAACTTSAYAKDFGMPGTLAPCCDFTLLEKCVASARAQGYEPVVGNVLSCDVFYNEDHPNALACWAKMGVLAVEMETAALYLNAMRMGKKAMAMFTITDDPIGDTAHLSVEERATGLSKMIKTALGAI